MPDFNHCQQCGRELVNTFFCHRCGHCLCSLNCMNRHEVRHALHERKAPGPNGIVVYPYKPCLN